MFPREHIDNAGTSWPANFPIVIGQLSQHQGSAAAERFLAPQHDLVIRQAQPVIGLRGVEDTDPYFIRTQ